jgi:membrane protein implicated in regulation of membrane protease activity
MLVWALIGVVTVLALGLWLVLPDSPITVALLFVVILGVVFAGVWAILASRRPDRSESSGTHRAGPGRVG